MLGRIGLALILLLLIWAGTQWGIRLWQDRLLSGTRDGNTLGDRVLFEPTRGQAMRFNIANHQGWVVLRGHVRAASALRRRSLPLTIDVRLLDRGGQEIFKQTRFLALQESDLITHPYGVITGGDQLPVWILPEEWVDLSGHPTARAVSVQVIDRDPALASVFWRASIRIRLTDQAAQLRYKRLSNSSRDALTARYVTPASLLGPQIPQQLLQHRLQPVGPLGREGVDYRTQRVLREPDARRQRDYSKPFYSLMLTPAQRVSMRLDQATTVRIQVETDRPQPPATELWRSGPAKPMRIAMIGREELKTTLPAGLYEFRTLGPVRIGVTQADTGAPVLPSGFHIRSAIVTPDAWLEYRLIANGSKVAPVRLEMRPLTASTRGWVRMLDVQGNTVDSRPFKLHAVPSLYDRMADSAGLPVSEAAVIVLDIPDGVRGLRIESNAAAAVTAFTRVQSAAGLQRTGARSDMSKRWFSFLPEQHQANDPKKILMVLRQPRMRNWPATQGPQPARAPARTPSAGAARMTRPTLRLRLDRSTRREIQDAP